MNEADRQHSGKGAAGGCYIPDRSCLSERGYMDAWQFLVEASANLAVILPGYN